MQIDELIEKSYNEREIINLSLNKDFLIKTNEVAEEGAEKSENIGD